jgi:hypothetical protein
MFVAPEHFDFRVATEGTPLYWAEQALALLRPPFDPQQPTALFIGRYQPFHASMSYRINIADGYRQGPALTLVGVAPRARALR